MKCLPPVAGVCALALLTIAPGLVASAAPPGGYAELVRRVAPGVVTVLVDEQVEGAGQRAANRALAANDNDPDAAIKALLQRLL